MSRGSHESGADLYLRKTPEIHGAASFLMNNFFLAWIILVFLIQSVYSAPVKSGILSLAFVGPAILNNLQNTRGNDQSTEIYSPRSFDIERPALHYRYISDTSLRAKLDDYKKFPTGLCELDLQDYFLNMMSMYKLLETFPQKKKLLQGLIEKGYYKTSLGRMPDVTFLGEVKSDVELAIFEDSENDQLGIVIPGTRSLNNFFHDIYLGRKNIETKSGYIRVHFGFYKMFQEIKDQTFDHIKYILETSKKKFKGITIFGHSMGAAIGSLLATELKEKRIEGLPVNLVTIGLPPVSNPSIPENDLADKVYHMYIPGDVVFGLTKLIDLKHPEGEKVPLKYKHINDPLHHTFKEYHRLYFEATDTCEI
jgi:hypothetical protein